VNETVPQLRALAAVDLEGWAGLPADLTVDATRAELALVTETTGRARLGERRSPATWIAAESSVYEGGLRVYSEGDEVLLVEGRAPITPSGEPIAAPDLGEPELELDAAVGPVSVERGEHVYAERGLAVQVSPGTSALLAVLAFAPTSAADYVERLRPELVPWSRFPVRRNG
jgi:hypothetical protein